MRLRDDLGIVLAAFARYGVPGERPIHLVALSDYLIIVLRRDLDFFCLHALCRLCT